MESNAGHSISNEDYLRKPRASTDRIEALDYRLRSRAQLLLRMRRRRIDVRTSNATYSCAHRDEAEGVV
jgi:hypothetical protein